MLTSWLCFDSERQQLSRFRPTCNSDVNINSIAPGIAAALLATVAGLAVAIPALFAYNWFASRIKEMSNEMQIFADELTSRIAERFES